MSHATKGKLSESRYLSVLFIDTSLLPKTVASTYLALHSVIVHE